MKIIGFREKCKKTSVFQPYSQIWEILAKKDHFLIFPKNAKIYFFRLQRLGLVQQARGARSLGKFPKYRNKKKSEKQMFTPKEIFQE